MDDITLWMSAVAVGVVAVGATFVFWLLFIDTRKYTCPKCGYQGTTRDPDQPATL